MTKKKFFVLIVCLMVASSAALLLIYLITKPAEIPLYRASLSNIEDTITMNGIVHSKRETLIMPYYGGYVKKLYVKQGDIIQRNDPLVEVARNLLLKEKVYPLRAPYEGIVTLINKTEGQFAEIGRSVNPDFILKIEDLNELFIRADASDTDIIKLQRRQSATIKLNSLPNLVFKGAVEEAALSSKTEEAQWGNQKVIYPVKVSLIEQNKMIRPGMSALVDVMVARKEKAIVIPIQFLHQEGEKTYVVLKNKNAREVEVGIITPLSVEIVKGLEVGEEIEGIDYFE